MRSKILAAMIVAAAASAASADTVQMKFVGTDEGRSVKVTIGSDTFNCFSGQLLHQFTAGNGVATQLNGLTKVTYCTDLTQVVTSSYDTYTVAPIGSLPQSAGWPAMGAGRAQAVYNLYAAGAGQQNLVTGNDDFASAFQIALWEIVYDYNPAIVGGYSLTAGNFKVKNTDGTALSSAISTKVGQLFALLGTIAPQTGLLGLTNDCSQDQIVQVNTIPLPTAAYAGLGGLVLAGIARKRLRR
ncbi:MAG: Cys-Gln thioester bond-forming surface protein [Phycisphaerales bacterium]